MVSTFEGGSEISRPFPEQSDLFVVEVPAQLEDVVLQSLLIQKSKSSQKGGSDQQVLASFPLRFAVVESVAESSIGLAESELPFWQVRAIYGPETPYPDACMYEFKLEI